MNISKKEIVAIIEYLEEEKGIDRESAVEIIKDSLASAIEKNKQVSGLDIYIDVASGRFVISSMREIVEKPIIKGMQISIEDVLKTAPTAKVGEYVIAPVDDSILCRNVAHKAWQTLRQKIENKSLEMLYNEYKNNSGNVVKGRVIKKMGKRSLLVDIGRMSAVLPGSNYPSNEFYREGDSISVVLFEEEIERENGDISKASSSSSIDKSSRIVLSRNCDEFIYGLLSNEIPEINDDTIRIIGMSRIPGVRCKVVVKSQDSNVDAVGACIGTRSSRIARISEDLKAEKLEIVQYFDDENSLIRAIFNSANVVDIVKYRKGDIDHIEIISDDEKFPAVVGRGGINVKLANKLLDKNIKVHRQTAFNLMIDEVKESLMSQDELVTREIGAGDFGGLLSRNIINKGYKTWGDILSSPTSSLISIEGMNINILYSALQALSQSNK